MNEALHRTMPHLKERFLRAAFVPALWEETLGSIAAATGSTRAQLIGVDQRGQLAFNIMSSMDESLASDFLQIAGHHDASVNFRIASMAADGVLVWEKHYDVAQSRIGDSAYFEACEKHSQSFGCQTSLAVEEGAVVGLALLRDRGEGRTTPEHREFFMAAAAAAQSALQLQRSIEEKGAAMAHGALDLVGAPIVLIDGFGRIASMTGAADAVIATHPAIDVKARMLVGSRLPDTRHLHQMVRRVIDRHELDASLLLQAPGSLPLRVTVRALPAMEMGFGFQPCALVTLGDGGERATSSGNLLREHYRLTSAESEVVGMLAQGKRRVDIADRRGTSLGTVQQQIKSIFAKTGVSREAELLALVAAV